MAAFFLEGAEYLGGAAESFLGGAAGAAGERAGEHFADESEGLFDDLGHLISDPIHDVIDVGREAQKKRRLDRINWLRRKAGLPEISEAPVYEHVMEPPWKKRRLNPTDEDVGEELPPLEYPALEDAPPRREGINLQDRRRQRLRDSLNARARDRHNLIVDRRQQQRLALPDAPPGTIVPYGSPGTRDDLTVPQVTPESAGTESGFSSFAEGIRRGYRKRRRENSEVDETGTRRRKRRRVKRNLFDTPESTTTVDRDVGPSEFSPGVQSPMTPLVRDGIRVYGKDGLYEPSPPGRHHLYSDYVRAVLRHDQRRSRQMGYPSGLSTWEDMKAAYNSEKRRVSRLSDQQRFEEAYEKAYVDQVTKEQAKSMKPGKKSKLQKDLEKGRRLINSGKKSKGTKLVKKVHSTLKHRAKKKALDSIKKGSDLSDIRMLPPELTHSTQMPRRGTNRTGGYHSRAEIKNVDRNFVSESPIDENSSVIECINLVGQGVTESQRVGRRYTVKSLHVKGHVTPMDGTTNPGQVRISLVQDMQTNGTPPAITDIYTTANAQSFRNLNNARRFKILKTKIVDFGVPSPGTAGAALAPGIKAFNLYVKLNTPVLCKQISADVASIATNSFYIVLQGSHSDASNSEGAVVKWSSRCLFTDS